MDLNFESIQDVIHPTAAYTLTTPSAPSPTVQNNAAACGEWSSSQLNPRNRIDSLAPLENPLWRIDGCTGLGTQYFARPLFLGNVPPVRLDVFIPEDGAAEPMIRKLLDLSTAFHARDGSRIQGLGITRYILRVLQAWTLAGGAGSLLTLAAMEKSLPYGSRIIFERLTFDVRKVKVTVALAHDVERQLSSVPKLAKAFGMDEKQLPPTVDLWQLSAVEQLQDSVCLVRVAKGGNYDGDPDRIWVLKALTSGFKYLYNELRNLLRMAPHPHVMARPGYLVTKRVVFGESKKGLVGFLLDFHPGGGLRDQIPLLRIHNQLDLGQKLKWARQLTSAVTHVRRKCGIYYTDLRLDNVVLSQSRDVVLLDFEQRGVWSEFAAPEVNALEYVRILATDGEDGSGLDSVISERDRAHFADVLDGLLPDWEFVLEAHDFEPLPHGYQSFNVPWLCLGPREQEAAEVYMVGRALWCLFEGQCAPQRAAVWQSYRREPDYEFPECRAAPPALRALVDRCTRGRRAMLSTLIVRRGSRLVLKNDPPGRPADAAEVLRVARAWWRDEVAYSVDFLRRRSELKASGEWDENSFGRPSMEEVEAALQAFAEDHGLTG